MSYDKSIHATLAQINMAIDQLREWNLGISCADDYLISPEGMKTLAATSMLLEAVGEGIKKIDRRTGGKLLQLQPHIPWKDVMGMRDHIAHGYFDIDADIIFDVVSNALDNLQDAINFLVQVIQERQN